MARLPAHHLPRPRLTDACVDANLVVVEAAGGFGKTVLAAELVDRWRSVCIEVQLDSDDSTAGLLAARLLAAVRRAGYTSAASSMAEAGEDAVAAADAALDALRAERCVLVIDDAHHAAPDAAALIVHLAGHLVGDQRMIVLARVLPRGAEKLRRAESTPLGSGDLALRGDETLAVCRHCFGLDVSEADAQAIDRATGGWTAATVLAAARARRTGEALASVATAVSLPAGADDAVGTILKEALAELGDAAEVGLAQVARLPVLDREVVDAAAGSAGFFDRALAAGIPFAPTGAGWLDLPGPVRDHLASLAPVEPEALRAAADAYRRRGELGSSLQLLLAVGDEVGAAAVLASTDLEAIEALELLELRAVVEALGPEAFAQHPDVLLIAARLCEVGTLISQRTVFLDRARAIADAGDDERYRRAVDVEFASDAMRDLEFQLAESEARRVLDESGPDELLTRARAQAVLGRTLCWRIDDSGRRDNASFAEAERALTQAADLYRRLGMRSAVAGLVPYVAMWLDFARGKASSALRRLDEALSLTEDRPRRWAYVQSFRSEVLMELGEHDEFEWSIAQILRIGDLLDNEQLRAWAHWNMAIMSSYRNDSAATLEHLREVEAHKAEWWGPAGSDFLVEAVMCLDRIGEVTLAREYLARVKEDPKDAEHMMVIAESSLEARHGDPARALELLTLTEERGVDLREQWRTTLLRAYARFRMGDHAAAGSLAAAAFEAAARLGQPELPLIRERVLTEELLGLAAETGKPAALALQVAALPVSLNLLGRFELTIGGRQVPLPAGKGTQLLKLVAVAGGPVPVDRVIETLWPDVDRETGRNRLRTNLSRLREAAADVVGRDGEMLALVDEVRVDVAAFLVEARRALALGADDLAVASSVARGAITRYRGVLLPDDLYEDWAVAPREQARRTLLELLDLCASDAERRGDLDDVRRIVERTIEVAPHDDARYLRAATTLLEQGRRGEALSIVSRAHGAFNEIGLSAPAALLELERSIID